ncbi:NADPH:quinone oxidoreductase family protein, partial [Phenylobacterium aquaticum]
MRALVVEELSADYSGCVVKDIPTPEPKPGEVLIKVRAGAVNFPDLMQTRGEHQHKPTVPFVPGMELAGEIAALGDGVTGWNVGDAVAAGARGGFAEYAVAPALGLHAKPAGLSFGQAAGYPVAYLTAYVALVRRAQVQPGEWVLVHGAAGGVGLACVDMAKLLGCKVIAASASDDKLAVIEREYAPDATVNVTKGFKDRVKEITGGRGADVIYDPVGGDVFDESVRCIAFDGRILSIGFTSGRLPVLPVNYALIKGFSVMGVRAG